MNVTELRLTRAAHIRVQLGTRVGLSHARWTARTLLYRVQHVSLVNTLRLVTTSVQPVICQIAQQVNINPARALPLRTECVQLVPLEIAQRVNMRRTRALPLRTECVRLVPLEIAQQVNMNPARALPLRTECVLQLYVLNLHPLQDTQ